MAYDFEVPITIYQLECPQHRTASSSSIASIACWTPTIMGHCTYLVLRVVTSLVLEVGAWLA